MAEKADLRETKQNSFSSDPFVFLTSVDEMEYVIIESLLKAYSIPCVKKHQGAGGYSSIYMGSSKFGIDVFVPRQFLEQAQELLEANTPIENTVDEIQADEEMEEYGQMNTTHRRNAAWVLLVIFGLPAVLTIISLVETFWQQK